jgi:hypothetical protein
LLLKTPTTANQGNCGLGIFDCGNAVLPPSKIRNPQSVIRNSAVSRFTDLRPCWYFHRHVHSTPFGENTSNGEIREISDWGFLIAENAVLPQAKIRNQQSPVSSKGESPPKINEPTG